jgi:hypothetical protein
MTAACRRPARTVVRRKANLRQDKECDSDSRKVVFLLVDALRIHGLSDFSYSTSVIGRQKSPKIMAKLTPTQPLLGKKEGLRDKGCFAFCD